MSTLVAPSPVPSPQPPAKTVKELLQRLGDIPTERVRADPPPGTATEKDVIAVETNENRLCELVDGTLVEKVMGYPESIPAIALAEALRVFVRPRKLGLVSGADGMVRLFPGMIRIPDVAFVSWDRIPGRTQPAPDLVPDLAIEVLSAGNTPAEMDRKLRDYFKAGVRLAWLLDLETRTVAVYTSPTLKAVRRESDMLDGGDVLPGFTLSLRDLFAELDEQA